MRSEKRARGGSRRTTTASPSACASCAGIGLAQGAAAGEGWGRLSHGRALPWDRRTPDSQTSTRAKPVGVVTYSRWPIRARPPATSASAIERPQLGLQ